MEVQKVAKTVSEAIDEALKDLDTTIDNIEYTVLQEPSKGFFGFGSKPAKVLVKLKEDLKIEESLPIREEIKEEKKEQPKRQETINIGDRKPIVETTTKQKTIKEKEAIVLNNSNSEKRVPKMVSEETIKNEKIDKTEKVKEINKDAPKIAIDFLTQIFEKMDINVKVDAKIVDKNVLSIKLKGKQIGVVIGKRGQTLDALQYLTNLVVNKGEYSYMSISIDTADYREKRKNTLEQLALNLAKKVKKTRRSINLEPMNPYERRVIHSALQNDPAIKTYSEGEEPFRYVVISLK